MSLSVESLRLWKVYLTFTIETRRIGKESSELEYTVYPIYVFESSSSIRALVYEPRSV